MNEVRPVYIYLMKEEIISQFRRDFERLDAELSQFKTDASLWYKTGSVSNPAGNLILHLCGNLRHFIGHLIGQLKYERKREEEFSNKDLSIESIRLILQITREEVLSTLEKLDPATLTEQYPVELAGLRFTVRGMLLHLAAHLNYHLGQINYIRRIQE